MIIGSFIERAIGYRGRGLTDYIGRWHREQEFVIVAPATREEYETEFVEMTGRIPDIPDDPTFRFYRISTD